MTEEGIATQHIAPMVAAGDGVLDTGKPQAIPNHRLVAESLSQLLMTRGRKLGLSRKRAAKILAVDEATLARWERDEARPSGQRAGRVEVSRCQ